MASSVSSQTILKFCYNCMQGPSSDLKKCEPCKVVYYCNKTCQREDWGQHKLECKSFQDLRDQSMGKIKEELKIDELKTESDQAFKLFLKFLEDLKEKMLGLSQNDSKEVGVLKKHFCENFSKLDEAFKNKSALFSKRLLLISQFERVFSNERILPVKYKQQYISWNLERELIKLNQEYMKLSSDFIQAMFNFLESKEIRRNEKVKDIFRFYPEIGMRYFPQALEVKPLFDQINQVEEAQREETMRGVFEGVKPEDFLKTFLSHYSSTKK